MNRPRTAERPADLPDREALLAISGMEFVERMLDGRLPQAAMMRLLNFRLVAAQPGRVTFHGTPRFDATNPMGGVHGGWYGALIDSAMGCAVMTRVPQGARYTTLEYKVNLTRALPLGVEVEARGEVSHAGRSTATATAEIRGREDGRLYASGSTTCLIMRD